MERAYGRAFALTLSVITLAGCTTTYVGHKLPVNGQLPTDKPSGIPFVMTRPEFTVDIAPDANDPTKAVYTLRSLDVPDPTQRYTIALDPALLVDGAFEFNLGEQGNLSEATATSTSKVIATLQALVSFAIDKAAPGIAKDMGSVLAQYRSVLKDSPNSACIKKSKESKDDVKAAINKFLDQLIVEAELEQKESDPTKAKAKASSLAASRFHYRDLDQRQCLVEIVPEAASAMDKSADAVQKTYVSELDNAKKTALDTDVLSKQWLQSLESAVKALDVAAVDKLEKVNVPAAVKKVSPAAKTFVNTKLDQKRLSLMAEQFAFMPAEVWRSRHLQYIERQLKQKRLDRLVADNRSKDAKQLDGDIVRLENEWAATLGEPKLVQRIAELDTFLSQVRFVPGSTSGAPRYAASEHIQLREERDRLQERLDRLRNEVVSKNKVIDAAPDKKKVEPRTDVHVRLVKPSFIKTVAANPGTIPDLPEFVLVVDADSMHEPTVLPDPMMAAKKGDN